MKIITFDITNTLIKVSGSVGHQYNKILLDSRYKFNLDKDLANKNFRKLFKEQNQKYPGYGFSKGMSSRHWWSMITTKLIEENFKYYTPEKKFSDDDVRRMSNIIFDEFSSAEYWHTYENCNKVLRDLRSDNYKLAIISNFDERLNSIIHNLKLSNFFEFIIIPSNSNGHAKPSETIFQLAKEQVYQIYGTPEKHEFLHIGDNIELDYKASRRCGFKSILMCHENVKETINSLDKSDEIRIGKNYATNLLNLKKKIVHKF